MTDGDNEQNCYIHQLKCGKFRIKLETADPMFIDVNPEKKADEEGKGDSENSRVKELSIGWNSHANAAWTIGH